VATAAASAVSPGAAEDARAGAVFAALADPTRRHLVEALAASPGATATGLASSLPISRQAVAKHLGLLREAGLVSRRRSGREALFELDPRPLAAAAAWLGTVGAEWEGSLGRLRALLER
jgi:ArsR family transcriptional regulator, cadmium/lead-responsive transcriptional repressor